MVQGELTEVRDRLQRAKDTSSALGEQSLRLIERARSLREECQARGSRASHRQRAVDPTMTVDIPPSIHQVATGGTGAAPIRDLHDPRLQLRSFRLAGQIGQHLVTASYETGVLDCDRLLRTHAELVVALGDSFPFGDPDHAIPASLDGPPVIVLLTLMRASFVTKVEAAV